MNTLVVIPGVYEAPAELAVVVSWEAGKTVQRTYADAAVTVDGVTSLFSPVISTFTSLEDFDKLLGKFLEYSHDVYYIPPDAVFTEGSSIICDSAQRVTVANVELYSGIEEYNNVRNASIKWMVNSETELTLGSVCSSMLECTLQTPYGGLNIAAGTEVELYKVDRDGNRTKVGLYSLEKPTRSSAHIYKITAYDRVSWLDKDLTSWLVALEGWPYTVSTFAQMVCEACGLTLTATEWINGDYKIQKFVANGITGRQLMKWIGEVEAKFVRANEDGDIELAWYRKSESAISPTGDSFYYSGGLSYEDYQVAPIQRVQIRMTEDDVGVVYPESEEDLNTYAITSNYLLTATDAETLEPVAQKIFENVKDFTYTPCEVKIPASLEISAGDVIDITDANGATITTCVMTKTQKGQSAILECTGSARRDSSTVVNSTSMALNAKMLEIRKNIEGLRIAATSIETALEETKKEITELELTADGIVTEVSEEIDGVETRVSNLEQTVEGFEFEVKDATGNACTLVLKSGSAEVAAAVIKLIGAVTFEDLETAGNTIINGDNISTGSLGAEKITLNGLFEVWHTYSGGGSFLGGYIGYQAGNIGGMVTDGIALLNKAKSCYAIATDAGIRLQSGESSLYMTLGSNQVSVDGALRISGHTNAKNGLDVSLGDYRYVGRSDDDETAFETWLDEQLADMAEYSFRHISFVSDPAIGWQTFCSMLYKFADNNQYAAVFGFSYTENNCLAIKRKNAGTWYSTVVGGIST